VRWIQTQHRRRNLITAQSVGNILSISASSRILLKKAEVDSCEIVREFDDDGTAIKNAQGLAAVLGRANCALGTKIVVTDESGHTIAVIPVEHLSS
jgi:hypothetical protein